MRRVVSKCPVTLGQRAAAQGAIRLYAGKSSGASVYAATLQPRLDQALKEIEEAGLYKRERTIVTPQSSSISVKERSEPVINFCANNYLGLADSQELIDVAKDHLDKFGLGLAPSVSFAVWLPRTQSIHKDLEKKIAEFHKTDDTILYTSCWDANGGIFETVLGEGDAVISDALNHASIIDGIRLCKAKRFRYKHLDMADLEEQLKKADGEGAKVRMIATDGAFSMDGDVAPLDKICALADKYNALVMVDESHATGFFGPTGRGVPEYFDVMDRIDVTNSTMGKALGGATGGYTTGRKAIVDLLRQRSRPYLFSNSLPPALVGATLRTFELLTTSTKLRDQLEANTARFRQGMKKAGFNVLGNDAHPICPVMLGDARLASKMAEEMLAHNIYVIGFSFPVVPKGEARIRVQLSAIHTPEQIDKAIAAFTAVGKKLNVIA
ncbi:2amino-3-ketobutyrate coenzyme A ligase [Acanthamoeba castellanii str. Neff]|uniref:2-amino-3-ketobutyrate coenzyme A ligase, mitochondrial n=1 Tax=Acanthamoeba castellanii (strain ATCC 30010 / Neff) TaxID=1257118 RepID=L8HCZ9_ACACF|nr:2amino-3-ketobutyrate coenzyme A ligase [Acanthamoeba castellanii str. Neff]ELR23060.1 2amino-3-ketobutyrate coenzyme A ligase [Acanthamoeba castellanii str. Neff]